MALWKCVNIYIGYCSNHCNRIPDKKQHGTRVGVGSGRLYFGSEFEREVVPGGENTVTGM